MLYAFKFKQMKIVEEYIVMSEQNEFFKVLLLENGLYLKYVDRAGRYEEIGKEYFEKCKKQIEC